MARLGLILSVTSPRGHAPPSHEEKYHFFQQLNTMEARQSPRFTGKLLLMG
jgi:hypothetical protein